MLRCTWDTRPVVEMSRPGAVMGRRLTVIMSPGLTVMTNGHDDGCADASTVTCCSRMPGFADTLPIQFARSSSPGPAVSSLNRSFCK